MLRQKIGKAKWVNRCHKSSFIGEPTLELLLNPVLNQREAAHIALRILLRAVHYLPRQQIGAPVNIGVDADCGGCEGRPRQVSSASSSSFPRRCCWRSLRCCRSCPFGNEATARAHHFDVVLRTLRDRRPDRNHRGFARSRPLHRRLHYWRDGGKPRNVAENRRTAPYDGRALDGCNGVCVEAPW
jgi:hypothetical protein